MGIILLNHLSGFTLERVASTNDSVKTLPPGSWISAENQTNGRGRNNKTWFSFGEEKIIFSGKISFNLDKFNITLLSPCVAYAVYQSLLDIFPQFTNIIKLKWPNDLFIEGKKFAGILIEPEIKEGSIEAIIGIGINLLAKETPAEISHLATSLFNSNILPNIEEAKCINKQKMIHGLIDRLNEIILAINNSENIMILKNLNNISLLNNQLIEFSYKNKIEIARVIEINANGFLLIETESGIIELTDSSGDIKTL